MLVAMTSATIQQIRPNGIPELHSVRMVAFPSGERFPVVSGPDRTPVLNVCAYLAEMRHNAHSTLEQKARAIALLLDHLADRGIDLNERAATGELLDHAELRDVRHTLLGVGARTAEIAANARRDGRGHVAETVGPRTHLIRLLACAAYLDERLIGATQDLKASPEKRYAIVRLLERMVERLTRALPRGESQPREGLTLAQYEFVGQVIHPANALNPFPEDSRQRNFALLLVYRVMGLRTGEPLLMRLEDLVVTDDGRPAIRLEPNSGKDSRSRPPQLKWGAARLIFIPPWCYAVIRDYIDVHRAAVVARLEAEGDRAALARLAEEPFIFLSLRGAPLSLPAVNKIFRALREAFPDELPPDLGPARLRNSWNDALMRAEFASKTDCSSIAEHSMGWVHNSRMRKRYARLAIASAAAEFLTANSPAFDEMLG